MTQAERKAAFLDNVARATRVRKFHAVQVRRSGYDSEVGKLGAADIQKLAEENGFAVREAGGNRNIRVFHLTVNQSA